MTLTDTIEFCLKKTRIDFSEIDAIFSEIDLDLMIEKDGEFEPFTGIFF